MGSPWHMHFCSFVITLQIFLLLFCVKINYFHCHCHCRCHCHYGPTITLPTRLSDNSSRLDNVFTTNVSNTLSAYILNVHISDHQPVVVFTDDDLPHKNLKYITIKTNSEEAKRHFCSSFKSKNIMDLLNRNIHATDPNENYEVLEQTPKEVYNESFPERIVRFNVKKHQNTLWITTGVLNSINRRNKLDKVLKQTKTDATSYATKKSNFNRYRNILSKTIAFAKRILDSCPFDKCFISIHFALCIVFAYVAGGGMYIHVYIL